MGSAVVGEVVVVVTSGLGVVACAWDALAGGVVAAWVNVSAGARMGACVACVTVGSVVVVVDA